MASTGFLFFLTLVIVGYYLLVIFWKHGSGRLYLSAVLLLLVAGAYFDTLDLDPMKSVYKLFVISSGFVLYALDLFDRAGDF
jgi:hypothetical protein